MSALLHIRRPERLQATCHQRELILQAFYRIGNAKEPSKNNLTDLVILCLRFLHSRKEGKVYGRPTSPPSVLLSLLNML